MVTIDIEPVQKTLTQVVEYLEYLKILDDTDKKSENDIYGKGKSENKTKTKFKVHKSTKRSKKTDKRRKRSIDSDSSSERKNIISRPKKFCNIHKAAGGLHWTDNVSYCGRLRYMKKSQGNRDSRKSNDYYSNEFNALIQDLITKALKESRKFPRAPRKLLKGIQTVKTLTERLVLAERNEKNSYL